MQCGAHAESPSTEVYIHGGHVHAAHVECGIPPAPDAADARGSLARLLDLALQSNPFSEQVMASAGVVTLAVSAAECMNCRMDFKSPSFHVRSAPGQNCRYRTSVGSRSQGKPVTGDHSRRSIRTVSGESGAAHRGRRQTTAFVWGAKKTDPSGSPLRPRTGRV